MSADDWVQDIKGNGTDSDSEDNSTLFEDNFRRMVEQGDVDSLNLQTIENQIGQIDDLELLATASEQDDRDGAVSVYQDRVATINQNGADESPEPSTEDEPEDSAEADGEDADDNSETVEDTDSGVDDSDDDDGASDDDDPVDEQPIEDTESSAGSGADESGSGDGPDTPETNADSGSTVAQEASDITAEKTAESSVSGELPPVDLSGIAPDATTTDEAADREKARTMLVWGREGTGKSHVAHSAPQPIAYIDTEGKADELAEKFGDKAIFYWTPDTYQEAVDALEQALDLLDQYFAEGVRGTIVVDSMSVMWEWAQVHHMELTRPSAEALDEVSFESSFGKGSGDWQKIKGYHNTEFRDRIVNSPYHAVLTAGAKEAYDYDEDDEDFSARWVDDGEKHNRYVVKEVVRLKTNAEGKTVGEVHKAAKTRYSVVDLVWPDWTALYDAIGDVADAEQADAPVSTDDWAFGVVDGKPRYVTEGSADDE